MLLTELATTHGYANVTVKGHAKQRQRDWRKLGHVAENTGKPNVSGWEQLAKVFPGTVVHGGERLVTQ